MPIAKERMLELSELASGASARDHFLSITQQASVGTVLIGRTSADVKQAYQAKVAGGQRVDVKSSYHAKVINTAKASVKVPVVKVNVCTN
jgi:hypothetical protein